MDDNDRWWDRTWVGVLNRLNDRHREQHRRLITELTDMAEELRCVKVHRDLLKYHVENLKRERDMAVEFTVNRAVNDWNEWNRTPDE